MDEFVIQAPATGTLQSQSDEALRDMIGEAKSILKTRQNARQKQAVSEIRRIAKEHGLDIAVNKPARKRGRPAKADTGST